jgi:hypothetical protein
MKMLDKKRILRIAGMESDTAEAIKVILGAHVDFGHDIGGLISHNQYNSIAECVIELLKSKEESKVNPAPFSNVRCSFEPTNEEIEKASIEYLQKSFGWTNRSGIKVQTRAAIRQFKGIMKILKESV